MGNFHIFLDEIRFKVGRKDSTVQGDFYFTPIVVVVVSFEGQYYIMRKLLHTCGTLQENLLRKEVT